MTRCADCGLLGMRAMFSREIVEAEFAYRNDGKIVRVVTGQTPHPAYEDYPLCLARKRDFRKDSKGECAPDKMLAVIQEEWNCLEFTEWNQGFTPKEHIEMGILELSRKQHREDEERHVRRQEESEKRHQDWQEKEQKWRREEAERSENALRQANRHHLVNLIVFGILITIVASVAQIFAALVERGVIFPGTP